MKIKVIIDKKGKEVFTISPDATLAEMVNDGIASHWFATGIGCRR